MTPGKRRDWEANRWIFDLIWCAECGQRVPRFRPPAPDDQPLLDAWRNSVKRGGRALLAAIDTLSALPGFDRRLAKLWLMHPDGPAETGRRTARRCPACSRFLLQPAVTRCAHCGHRWPRTAESGPAPGP